jgi:hypothetical protein
VVNPQERRGWYYVVPSFFLALQMLVAVLEPHCGWLERRAPAAATAALLLFAALWWPRVSHTVHRIVESLDVVEGERIAVGAWIRRHAAPGDTLVAGHGHIVREAGLYTVDFTGLNSRLVTDLGCDLGRVLDRVRPRWVAHDGLLDSAVAARNGLFLVRSFFNLAERGGPAWRVYRRGDGAAPGAVRPLHAADADAEGTVEDRGATIRLRTRQAEFRIRGDAGALSVGVCRQTTRLALRARAESADDSVRVVERPLVARDTLRPAEGLTEEWVIPLAGRPPYRVSVVAADPAGTVTPSLLLLDPVAVGRVP